MIGAVVGVQPFGGRGLSGTGPKAGGPLYLTRLVKEKTSLKEHKLSAQEMEALQSTFTTNTSATSQVTMKLQSSAGSELMWQMQDLNTRISVMRQLIAKLVSEPLVIAQEQDLEQGLENARKQLTFIEKALAKPQVMPGPTGESNKVYLEARGLVACIRCQHTSFNDWMMSVITSLAAGNSVIALVDDKYIGEAELARNAILATSTPDSILQVVSLSELPTVLTSDHLAGAVVNFTSPLKQLVSETLAARAGAILPLISAQSAKALFYRLVTEKTVSIDTTAAGGNASLMTMEAAD
jgi:RHH-type proline utilization regulon transcriptional repressor/proline dehydrogenase/delta 1-pyrroline-5-carboxylate dehydrogenase